MTAGNSTPLTDGASAVLLASEEWAAERGLPVLAYFVDAQTAAVDHVHKGEGLLMAPAYAMPRLLDRNGLGFGDFDLFEIHEAFAVAGAGDADGVARPGVRARAARARRAAGRDRPRPSSTSTAARWPPGTRSPRPAGGSWPRWPRRWTSAAAGRGVISICAAGGQGVVAILEKSMSDRYSQLVRLPVAGTVAKRIGLPQPVELERGPAS